MAVNQLLQKTKFWWLLLAAIIVTRLPIISIPFNWLETYFHELSHGLVAIITGGKVINIELFTNGAGLCTTQGGSRFFISFMGYTGAIIWGAIIYLAAKAKPAMAKNYCLFLILVLLSSLIFWVRDLLTLIIVISLMALFYGKWRLNTQYLGLIFQFTGMLIMLNAVLSPLHLLDGRHIGDGAALATITYIPEFIWTIIWSGLGIIVLYRIGKSS